MLSLFIAANKSPLGRLYNHARRRSNERQPCQKNCTHLYANKLISIDTLFPPGVSPLFTSVLSVAVLLTVGVAVLLDVGVVVPLNVGVAVLLDMSMAAL